MQFAVRYLAFFTAFWVFILIAGPAAGGLHGPAEKIQAKKNHAVREGKIVSTINIQHSLLVLTPGTSVLLGPAGERDIVGRIEAARIYPTSVSGVAVSYDVSWWDGKTKCMEADVTRDEFDVSDPVYTRIGFGQ